MPEKAEKKSELVTQNKKLEASVRCKDINIMLTIHRSTSINEFLGLKKIDSIEHSKIKMRVCVNRESAALRFFC